MKGFFEAQNTFLCTFFKEDYQQFFTKLFKSLLMMSCVKITQVVVTMISCMLSWKSTTLKKLKVSLVIIIYVWTHLSGWQYMPKVITVKHHIYLYKQSTSSLPKKQYPTLFARKQFFSNELCNHCVNCCFIFDVNKSDPISFSVTMHLRNLFLLTWFSIL